MSILAGASVFETRQFTRVSASGDAIREAEVQASEA